MAVLGTGYTLDLARQPALAAVSREMLLWADRVAPEVAALYPELARHPYRNRGVGLVGRDGADPAPSRIQLLGTPSAVSHGTLAADIPGLAPSCLRLAGAIAGALFTADAESPAERLFAFDEPELATTAYFIPEPSVASADAERAQPSARGTSSTRATRRLLKSEERQGQPNLSHANVCNMRIDNPQNM